MTVATTTNKKSYTGDGSVSQFSVPFPFYDDTDLEVLTKVSGADSYAQATLGVDYNVIGNGQLITGEVDWLVAPPVSGVTVLIRRTIPQTQGSDYVNNDIFNAEVLEDDLDRAVMRDQQIQEALDRAVIMGPFQDGKTLPEPLDGYFIFWSGSNLANGLPGGVSGTTVTPFAATLLDDTSAAQARATLGLGLDDTWTIGSGGKILINSGGGITASTGATVDLTNADILVPQGAAASGVGSGAIQLNGSDLEIDPDGTGFDPVGGRLTFLTSADLIISGTNDSYAEYTLSVPDGTWAVNVHWNIVDGGNTARLYVKSNAGGSDILLGLQGVGNTAIYLDGTIVLPLDSSKKIQAKKDPASTRYTLTLLGYWR